MYEAGVTAIRLFAAFLAMGIEDGMNLIDQARAQLHQLIPNLFR
jgi:hypothetical protein